LLYGQQIIVLAFIYGFLACQSPSFSFKIRSLMDPF